jgi:hypothetical protein
VAQEARIVLPAGVANQAYSQSLSEILKETYHLALKTSSDTPAYEWRLPGPGPAGLGIDPATGTILGTPTIAKRYLFRVEVLDRSLPQPAPLKLLVSLQITSGEAPVLEQVTQTPLEPPRQPPSGEAQFDTEDVEIPTIVPRKNFTLPIRIKKDSIRRLEVTAQKKGSSNIVSALTPADLPRGDVLTSVTLPLEEGESTIEVKDVSTRYIYRRFSVTVGPTDVDKPAETTVELKHSGFVSEKDENTSVTVTVGPKVNKIEIAAFEKDAAGALTKPLDKIEAPALKRDTEDYPVVIPLSKADVTKVIVKDLTPGSHVEKSIEIKRNKALNTKAAKDSEGNSEITIIKPKDDDDVPDASVDTYVKVKKGSAIKKIRYEVSNGDKIHKSEEIEVAPTDKDDYEKRIRVPIIIGKNIVRFFNAGDEGNLKQQAIIKVTCGKNCATTFDPAQFSGSQNSRTIVGLEQAGASSATSETKPFIDFFFSTPFLFSRCPVAPTLSNPPTPDEERKKRKHDQCVADPPPRLAAWGNVRLTTTPDQIAAVGVLPSNFVNQIDDATKTVDLVQSFDFLMGLEGRLFTANGKFLSLIPGINQRTRFFWAAGGGAISPLTARRQLAQIFKIPGKNSPQRDDFVERFGTPPESDPAKEFVGLVPVERDRFLRQWYAGLRLKTFYCDDVDCERYKNRFPAIVDFMVGQSEAVTGGRLFYVKEDPNDPTKTIKKRSFVLRFDAFYPFPLREANFLYFYGTAILKVGAGGVRIQNPLFLDRAADDVQITDPRVFIPSSDRQQMFQPNRDYYKLGIGINLTELLNRRKSSGN